ncbi:MAG: NAD(P)/FAD-dependent oxidoreductase [Balneola sp.]
MNNSFDYCILGAGLAGVSLAHELLKENATVCLVDPYGVASGASGTPLGLVNPATGRYAMISWEAEKCYSKIKKNLALVQAHSPIQFFKESGVLRPALENKIATRMKENFSTQPWPDGWIEWLDEDDLKSFHPGITCKGGGVWLPIGLTVDIGTYLNAFVDYLGGLGLKSFFNQSYSLSEKENYWLIECTQATKIKADNLVFATGASTCSFSFWKNLPIHLVKGQLAVMKADTPLSFKHAVSAQGYNASLDTKQFVIGSTYEHNFDHEDIDVKELEYLLNRFKKVLPKLHLDSRVIHQWSGIRVSTPNRMPILGEHPEYSHCFVFTGLGSKGLLYSRYLSELMKDFLLNQIPIPKELSITRLDFTP